MILITLNDAADAEHLQKQIAEELSPDAVKLSKGARGFDGVIQSDVIILAATVAPIIVQKIAAVLIGLVKANAERHVSVNGVSIKGYSADDVVRLLASAPTSGRRRQKKSE
jgi:hypothetical protein